MTAILRARLLTLLLPLFAAGTLPAWAAGQIDFAAGDAAVLDRDGRTRGAVRGARVVEGEAIVTGADGEVVVATDDAGVLAVRPQSRLLLEQYAISGSAADTVVLRLLRGGLRSITGWIGSTAPRRYRLTTPTATIGIRGTDFETAIAEEGGAGTYHRVLEGSTELATDRGTLAVQAGEAAQAPTGEAPQRLAGWAPPGVFAAYASDAAVDALAQALAATRAERLRTRQEQLRRSGGASPEGNPRVSAQCTPDAPAQRVFDALLRAYEQGNTAFLLQRLDPSMIGYGFLLNDIQLAFAQQRQVQIRVLERQMQCGPDVAVIDFSWERRWLDATTFAPQLASGRGQVLLAGLGGGERGGWRVAAFNGDNPLRTLAVRPAPVPANPGTPAPTNPGTPAAPAPNPIPPAPPTGAVGTLTVNPPALSQSSLPASCTVPTVSGVVTAAINFPATATMGYGSTCNVAPATFTCTLTSALFPATTTAPASVQPSCAVPFHTQSHTVPLNFVTSATQAVTAPAGSSVTLAMMGSATATGTFTEGAAAPQTYTVTSTAYPVCSATVRIPPQPPVCTPVRSTAPVAIQVQDADLTAASVPVQLTASNGDAEQLVLTRIGPGLYQLATLPVVRGAVAPVPGNGTVDLPGTATGPVTLTLRYTDALAGTGAGAVRTAALVLTP